jgi:hypothetical protein
VAARSFHSLPLGVRGAGIFALGALLIVAIPAVATADSTTCRVRNLTQGTEGGVLAPMIGQARDGDRLRVRGTCDAGVTIDKDIVISGMGVGATLTGNGRTRVLSVQRGATVTLRDLTIEGGRTADAVGVPGGAGVRNVGRLTLSGITVRANTAGDHCGGIDNEGEMLLVDSRVRGNTAERSGGGICNSGRLVLRRTIVSGNATTEMQYDPYGGGGIMSSGRLTLVHSAVMGNHAADYGGGILGSGTVILKGSIVSGNTADFGGGGAICMRRGTLTITESLVAHNTGKWGGAIANSATFHLRRSTVSGNSALGWGGGIWNDGKLSVAASTVSGNSVGSEGGGIYNSTNSGSVTLGAASSVRGNVPDNCFNVPGC